jgi:Yip1 domain
MGDNVSVGSPTAPPAAAAGADHLPGRLLGVIFSPRATFERIVAKPRWIAALAVVTVVVSVCTFAFLSTEVGQVAWLDQQVRQREAFGSPMTAEQYAQMEKIAPFVGYVGGGTTLIFVPVVTLVLAGILFAVFNALLGGSATYKQVAAVMAHSGAVSIIQQLFLLPLNYVRESLSSATNLGLFVPFLDEGNVVARFLGVIDLFIVWWLLMVAIGLGVLYRRRTGPIFWSFIGVYVVIALVIALVMRGASGGA